MIEIKYVLKYSDIYSDEMKEPIEYLKNIPFEELKKIISFRHTNITDLSNIFSDRIKQNNLDAKIRSLEYSHVTLERTDANLRIIELFIAYKTILPLNLTSIDVFEENVFKAFLSMNQVIEDKENIGMAQLPDDINYILHYSYFFLVNQFGISDTEQNRNPADLAKFVYSTIYKLEKLFAFFNEKGLEIIVKNIVSKFNCSDEDSLLLLTKQILYRFLIEKSNKANVHKILVREEAIFLNTLYNENVTIEEDFRSLKENPLFQISSDMYTYYDFLFLIDRFYKGVKFNIKKEYDAQNLKTKFGDFFSFYNLEFSEKFLFQNLCNEIFHKKYFHKIPKSETEITDEPDYYIRYNNDIFVFESKDIMIHGSIKSSMDLNKILDEFKKKLLFDKKDVGVNQLVNHIERMIDKKFNFDSYVNEKSKNNFRIYPILVLHERIFDLTGFNNILNQWYIDSVKSKLGNKYDKNRIKNLTVIDIDTFISLRDYFKKGDKNFKNLLDSHLKDLEKTSFKIEKELQRYIAPISRKAPLELTNAIMTQIKDVFPNL